MIIKKIKRKLYKAIHPVVCEIWMLHRVVEQRSIVSEQRKLEVTPEWLEQQIMERHAHGWKFVSIDDIGKILKNTKLFLFSFRCPRFICLTFDDGYRDNYTLAYPLLKRLDVPFTIYVTAGFINNQLPMWWYPDEKLGISTDELKQLDTDTLCTIGAHTISHPKLDTFSHEQQYKEINNSKQMLEVLLDHEVQHFSFPHGAHNEDTIAICRKLDFQTVMMAWGGPLRYGADSWLLPRINITQP